MKRTIALTAASLIVLASSGTAQAQFVTPYGYPGGYRYATPSYGFYKQQTRSFYQPGRAFYPGVGLGRQSLFAPRGGFGITTRSLQVYPRGGVPYRGFSPRSVPGRYYRRW